MVSRRYAELADARPDDGQAVQPGLNRRHNQLRLRAAVSATARVGILVATLACAGVDAGDFDEMIQVADLREAAQVARAKNLVMMIEFSSEYCGYCRKLEELFLLPMQRNEDYDAKVLIRSISLDPHETVIDLDGRLLDTNRFAARYGISLTPTLVFLNSEGIELSEKLVGIWSEDFYGAYIDQRIGQARRRLSD